MNDRYTVLLPVYRGALHAHIEKGIHWSEVEHLILYGLAQKDFTSYELAKSAGLPRAVIVEAVIRFIRVGWVEVIETSSRISFKSSPAGLVEAEKESLTHIVRRTSRKLHYVIEQLTGGVYGTEGLSLIKEYEAKRLMKNNTDVYALSSIIKDDELLGHIELLDRLSLDQNIVSSSEKPIGCDTDSSWCDDDWYIKLSVLAGRIEGLPSYNSTKLQEIVANCVEAQVGEGAESPTKIVNQMEVELSWPVRNIELRKDDIIIGGPEHESILQSIIENARSRVIIHSTFIYPLRIKNQIELLKRAANRGVKIDILWDKSDSSKDENILHECRELLKVHGLTDRIRVTAFQTNSHLKVIFSDDGSGSYFAVIGSCNWFASGFKSMEVSVQLRSPDIVVDCLTIIEKLMPAGFRESSLRDEIVAIAVILRELPPLKSETTQARLVSLGDHEHFIHKARDSAQKSIFVASNLAGIAIENQVFAPLSSASRDRPLDVAVYYQSIRKDNPVTPEVIGELNRRYGETIKINTIRKAHAKILCWDADHVVITSLNWLSKDSYGRNQIGEIGVYIEGEGLAEHVKKEYLRGKK